MEKTRIDKWLWAARFFKTRSLATQEVDRGRVLLNTLEVKPAKEIKVDDTVRVLQGKILRTVVVKAISEQRGPASVAQLLYEETPQSLQDRAQAAEQHRLSPEPALAIAHGRPTKRDRRDLKKTDWNNRWSASVD
ncbi:MAG: RNA-binding S4 domain-containing protein [Rhodoferax sp.]|nr:RNA-binding S4 domain-containing protein [Rhodoferax sp.]